MPKVSIVIPVYNGANFLAEAIDSALAQTYPNIEVLVVNDGSSDNEATERIARSYGDRIRYEFKTNGGVASALNVAVEKMSGDYFSWLSHDDLYLPQKVEIQMQALLRQGDGKAIIYSNHADFIGSPDKAIAIALKHIDPEQFRYSITTENRLHGCTLLIPRAAFAECGVFDETLRTTQDYDLWYRMAGQYRFIHIPKVLVQARAHARQGGISMGGIALEECNALLTKFVTELTPGEIGKGSQRSVAVGYALITVTMWRRGFHSAASHALRLTLRSIRAANTLDRLMALSILTRGMILGTGYSFIKRLAKKVLPAFVRERLRRLLNQSTEHSVTFVPSVNSVQHLALKEKFSEVYDKNIFGGPESRSGAGSDLVQTEIIRREIPRVIRQYGIKSMLDAPCGDWCWMRHVELGVERYVGVDIVQELIAKNAREFSRPGVEFQCLDLSTDVLPQAELIFSRDCLVHLSYDDAIKVLANFKASGAQYLLATTFTQRPTNTDLGGSFWRPINKQVGPFNFPEPLEIINEGCTEGNNEFTDKSLGLWKLDDIILAPSR